MGAGTGPNTAHSLFNPQINNLSYGIECILGNFS